jgi:hypothetical protein
MLRRVNGILPAGWLYTAAFHFARGAVQKRPLFTKPKSHDVRRYVDLVLFMAA